ncbi:hypothetical protein F7725_025336, partial [Dissostichus mawsoni]
GITCFQHVRLLVPFLYRRINQFLFVDERYKVSVLKINKRETGRVRNRGSVSWRRCLCVCPLIPLLFAPYRPLSVPQGAVLGPQEMPALLLRPRPALPFITVQAECNAWPDRGGRPGPPDTRKTKRFCELHYPSCRAAIVSGPQVADSTLVVSGVGSIQRGGPGRQSDGRTRHNWKVAIFWSSLLLPPSSVVRSTGSVSSFSGPASATGGLLFSGGLRFPGTRPVRVRTGVSAMAFSSLRGPLTSSQCHATTLSSSVLSERRREDIEEEGGHRMGHFNAFYIMKGKDGFSLHFRSSPQS